MGRWGEKVVRWDGFVWRDRMSSIQGKVTASRGHLGVSGVKYS